MVPTLVLRIMNCRKIGKIGIVQSAQGQKCDFSKIYF